MGGASAKGCSIAVISNPHAGKGYVEDLSDLTDASIELGSKIATMG